LNLKESTPITIESDLLPKGWQVVKLGDAIEELKNGFASGKRDDNGIVQIRMNNVTTDGRLIFDSYLKVPVPENINNWLLKNGDLLFNNTNSIDLVGKSTIFNEAPFSCTFSNHFTRLRFKKEMVLPELILYHFLILWKNDYFKSVAIRHVGQSAVHTSYLLKLQIPLPPLPEQRRIAEVLGTVDSAIQKVGGAIESTERLKKGLMQRLLTRGIGHERFKESEVGRVPVEWEVARLGYVCNQKSEITMPSGKGENKFVGLEHINPGEIKIHTYQLDTDVKSSKFIFRRGEILYGKLRPYLDKAVIADFDGICSTDLLVLTNINNKALAEFLIYLIHSNKFIQNSISATSGTNHPRTSWKEIRKFKFGLPPLPEQRRIAEILSAVDRKLELERRRKEKLERVKKGLMNELLTGRKRLRAEN